MPEKAQENAPELASSGALWRKRRGLVARPRYGEGYISIAIVPPVEHVGQSRRAKLSKPRATIDVSTRERIRDLAVQGSSLRKIAEAVNVSHESVRKVLAAATLNVEA